MPGIYWPDVTKDVQEHLKACTTRPKEYCEDMENVMEVNVIAGGDLTLISLYVVIFPTIILN